MESQYAPEAYLDIETTGLYPRYNEITVVGIYLTSGVDTQFVQLVGEDITADNILEALRGVTVIYTYNWACKEMHERKLTLRPLINKYGDN